MAIEALGTELNYNGWTREYVLVVFGVIPLTTLLVWNIWVYLSSPVRKYPGPFLAKWTNLWRFYHLVREDLHVVSDTLHQRYGPIVCIGPDIIDVADPEMLKTVFNQTRSDWKKTVLYQGAGAKVGSEMIHNTFSEQDPDKHARLKRPVGKYFTISGVASMESHIDKVIGQLCCIIETKYIDNPGGPTTFDLSQWLLYYAWDVVGGITFSRPLGYLQHGRDFNGTLATSQKNIDWLLKTGMFPWWNRYVLPLLHVDNGPGSVQDTLDVCLQRIQDRVMGNDAGHHSPDKPDFLDRCFEARAAHPDTTDDGHVANWLMSYLLAGADSTSGALCSALYFSLKNPRVWARLQSEISTVAGLHAEEMPFSYKAARGLPYLEAVIREALRVLPGVSVALERYVPAEGYHTAAGTFLPGGTVVGANPYVLSRNREVYGEDVDVFRPERWLRDAEAGEGIPEFEKRLAAMNAIDFTFGGGSRTCLGKNVALLQVYKVVATMVGRYDIELASPEKDWQVTGSWFPRHAGIDVKITRKAHR